MGALSLPHFQTTAATPAPWTWKPPEEFPCNCKYIFGWQAPLHKSPVVLSETDLGNQFYPFCHHFFTLVPLPTAGLNQEHPDTSEHWSPEITAQRWARFCSFPCCSTPTPPKPHTDPAVCLLLGKAHLLLLTLALLIIEHILWEGAG